jgi:hypothetical protein
VSLETRAKINIVLSVIALVIAVAAPLLANSFFGIWRPETDTTGVWLERSGAITTIFSLLAVSLMDEGLSAIHKPGAMIDLHKVGALAAFEEWADWIKGFALILTIAGAIIWGYGSVIF